MNPDLGHDEEQQRDPVAESERLVLGGMMGGLEAVWPVLDLLVPSDFAEPKHEVIARTIAVLAQRGVTPDPVAVTDELGRLRQVQQAGGMAYVMSMDTLVTPGTTEHHATLVAAHAVRRRLALAARQMLALTQEASEPNVLIEQAGSLVAEALERRSAQLPAFGDSFQRLVERLDARTPLYTPTPWRDLNGYVHGWHPGRLYVIGARPSAGKSIMALQAAMAIAEQRPVYFASLEMSRDDLMQRAVAHHAQVSMTNLERNTLTDAEWRQMMDVRPYVQRLALRVDDRPDATVQRIVAQARALRHRDGDLAAVVVDYLGLLRTPTDKRGRWEHVGDISRALKNLAQSMQVPVIALAQLNRESVQAGKPRDPGLQDLRESGSIEQDADVVLLLQRRIIEGQDTGYVDVHVAKNRHGRIGRFPLRFQGWWARMEDTQRGEADGRDTSEELTA